MNINFVTVFVYGYITLCTCAPDILKSSDTYVNALQNSHDFIDYDSNKDGNKYDYATDNSFLPLATEGGYQYSPKTDNAYLPPVSSPPVPSYGLPPVPIFNSHPPLVYRPSNPLLYHTPHSFLDKLKSKISLLTIGKIVLKLLIFKKIVKFIGVICLLLVLPKLNNLFNGGMPLEDENLSSKVVQTDKDLLQNQIDEVFEFVQNSIHGFKKYL